MRSYAFAQGKPEKFSEHLSSDCVSPKYIQFRFYLYNSGILYEWYARRLAPEDALFIDILRMSSLRNGRGSCLGDPL